MVNATATTWRVVGIAYATVTHMNSYIENKDSGISRFVIEEGTENEMKDRFAALKRICPTIELYDNNGVVERHDEILGTCVKEYFEDTGELKCSDHYPEADDNVYTRIGKLMFRI